jgi:Terpene cyclase DEP1
MVTSLRSTHGRDRVLCVCYGLGTAVGFLVMAGMALAYVLKQGDANLLRVAADFVREALSTLAGGFVYADLTLVWIVLAVFMVHEARRLGIRHVWAYIVAAPLLALAVSLPAFMLVRQLKIARKEGTDGR